MRKLENPLGVVEDDRNSPLCGDYMAVFMPKEEVPEVGTGLNIDGSPYTVLDVESPFNKHSTVYVVRNDTYKKLLREDGANES